MTSSTSKPLPVATRLVAQALREEAETARALASTPWDYGIAHALGAVADRLERSGSSVRPRTPPSDPDAAAVSSPAPEPTRVDEQHPGPSVVVTDPGPVHAVLIELKREIEPYRPTPRIRQLLDDAIKLSSGDC